MDQTTLPSIIASFIGFFVVMYFSNQKEEGGFVRSILVAIIVSMLLLLTVYGTIGYVVALIATFLILTLFQKYSFVASFLVIIVGGLLSYILELGLQNYF